MTMYDLLKKRNEEAKLIKRSEDPSSIISIFRADAEVRENRYNICNGCEHFISLTTTCSKCGCFMKMKTWLKDVKCPIGKWN